MPETAAAGPGLTLGTAGHIDHGKTRLVAALTGADTDRLEEERRRGISIELGFAELELPDGERLGLVDVPGHERLVRTMVAGATGIDLFLLVVAADDGVMPQTTEHLEALRALGVTHGVVALNKADLVDAELRGLVTEELRELLPGRPIVTTSAKTGDGIERLRTAIAAEAAVVAAERAGGDDGDWPPAPGVLHADRSFTITGAGTVVTGTVASGAFGTGDRVTVLPTGTSARIRSIESHGRPVASASRGRRAALNLTGVDRTEVPRGSVIGTDPESPSASYRLDVRLLGAAAEGGRPRRLQVHHGTRDAAARLVDLGNGLVQLRLESPLVVCAGDRLVLRSISPPGTLGGAVVLDPDPRRHGAGPEADRLLELEAGDPAEILRAALTESPAGIPAEPAVWHREPRLAYALPRFEERAWTETVEALVAAGDARRDGERLVLAQADTPTPAAATPLPPRLEAEAVSALAALRADGAEPRSVQTLTDDLGIERVETVAILDSLTDRGRLRRITPDVYMDADTLAHLERKVLAVAVERGSISLAEARDELRTSRKYAQALVEHLDREGLTVRRGDRHLPRASATGGA